MVGGETPDVGDLVWINFTPQAGKEQAGVRPALVLSPKSYNTRTGLLIACPITSRSKGYPFEVALPEGLAISGYVLSDHVKSIDWSERGGKIVGQVTDETLDEVKAKIGALLDI